MKAERSFQEASVAAINQHAPDHVFRLILPATETGVRRGLAGITSSLKKIDFADFDITNVELALAEVLNNVVEHAYANRSDGEISVNLSVTHVGLFCTVVDDGCEMPNAEPPMGHCADPTAAIADLPEGGFGWFLIRQLAEDLEYSRVGDQNRLDFRMLVGLDRDV